MKFKGQFTIGEAASLPNHPVRKKEVDEVITTINSNNTTVIDSINTKLEAIITRLNELGVDTTGW